MQWVFFNVGVFFKDLGEQLKWNGLIRFGLNIREVAFNHGKAE
jgi:hypothetical protein